MRHHDDGVLGFAPRLPDAITRLAFNLFLRDQRLRVEITRDRARYVLGDGDPMDITHHGQPARVTAGKPVELPMPSIVAPPAPAQPQGRAPAPRHGSDPK